ncbi:MULTISPECIES: transposase family protein [unclassified Streptomyces]|uniref:transposase family protein n=1 Tax=unclassified Streptomyces TaxID=2593676 RepID=UPI00137070EB|nr:MULTISPECIES: transposase family protein [unclassified Streptomyces]NDZ99621.1 transposase [Streptomyces sp. SID10116]MYY82064.1 transposase [Streptomyces sp. SID335]MYZ16381.1 transposase [Streptomyces sp. SID337]NDZ90629.1 transposase [Streptomyces sp. SID10115]NEB48964.1 transposase [Streptomyces sp. SID339]
MAGVLRANRVWVETFTGLRIEQLGRLMKAVWERGGNGTLRGRPWSLPLAERVLVVAAYYRTNLTMRQLGPLFRRSSSTVCRVIQKLGPLLALEPLTRPADAADRLWSVDGTLAPVRDRDVGSSSRNYRFSANVQLIVDADTRLVIAAARPVPGTTADAPAWRASGLAGHRQGVTVLGDGAYLNCGMAVPHRKRPRRELLSGAEADNAAHRTVRARVEHVIGRMKNYKILRDCRQRGDGLHHAVQAVAHMHNLALTS